MSLFKCPECGFSISHSSMVCDDCGASLHTLEEISNFYYCTHCGFTNEAETDFCIKCKYPLTKSAVAELEFNHLLNL